MAYCYNLISKNETLYPSIFGIQYTNGSVFDGEDVYISGDPLKVYTLKEQRQAFIRNLDNITFFTSAVDSAYELADEGGTINWKATSIILNGVEKIDIVPEIDVTPADINYVECNDYYSIPTTESSTVQYSNFVDFLNSIFESKGISLLAKVVDVPTFTVETFEGFALLFSEGDSISITITKTWSTFDVYYIITIDENGVITMDFNGAYDMTDGYTLITSDKFYVTQNELKLYTPFEIDEVYEAWANSVVGANCGSGCLNVNNPCQNKSFLYSMFFYMGIEGLTIYNEKDYTAKFDELLLALTDKITALNLTDNSGESDIVLNSVIDGAILGLSKNIYTYCLKELYGINCCSKSIYEIINYINIIKVIQWNNISQFLSSETINCLEYKLSEVSVCSDLEAGDFNEDFNDDFY